MRDKHNAPIALGDEVYCYIAGSPGCYGYIIGVMSYAAKAEDVVCIAGPDFTGMPVNTGHLQRMGPGNPELVSALRAKYLAVTPGAFKSV
jgi:hypothetical protein